MIIMMQYKRVLQFLFVLVVAFSLSGCLFGSKGYIHDREDDYLSSENIPATKLPANLKPAKVKASFPIPEGKSFSEPVKPSLIPPGNAGALKKKSNVKPVSRLIKQSVIGLGNDGFPVLKLAKSYKQVWTSLDKKLPDHQYQVIGSDSKTGIIEVKVPSTIVSNIDIVQLKVVDGDDATLVSALDETGQAIDENQSKAILKNLQTLLK
jgi:uncharacterized lipoprotein